MARFVLIHHGDGPDDDRVVSFLRAREIDPEIRKPFKGETLGDVDSSIAGSVVFGGPFNVFDEDRYPFLHEENRWIEQCIKHGVPLLGICQGAQSIARVLGAEVGPKPGEPHEFGYYTITPTALGRDYFPDPLVVAQAHFHEFQIPAGAERLAASKSFANQAFKYGGQTFGLQFHPEVTAAGFRRWQNRAWAPYGKPGVQPRQEQDQLMLRHDAAQHAWFMGFLERLFGPVING